MHKLFIEKSTLLVPEQLMHYELIPTQVSH